MLYSFLVILTKPCKLTFKLFQNNNLFQSILQTKKEKEDESEKTRV